MPTYVYECKECYFLWELVQSMKDESVKVCSECGKESARRILQSPALTADATPNRGRNKIPPRRPNNNWERGKAGEHRADGSFVPYVKADGDNIPIKEFADNRSKYEGLLRERKNKQSTTK